MLGVTTTICTTQTEVDNAAARGDTIIINDTWTDPVRAIVKGSSRVVARESSSVVARESSRVVARGSSSVEAWESSSVEAWGSSRVEARGSSRVEARESSSVVAWGRASARQISDDAQCTGNAYRVQTGAEWADYEGIDVIDGHVMLYKALSADLTGGHGHGVTYEVGATVVAGDWDPATGVQCGGGLHLCAHPAQALAYNSEAVSVVECRVALDDVAVYEPDMSKVRCRQVDVVRTSHTVDRGWPVPVADVEASA